MYVSGPLSSNLQATYGQLLDNLWATFGQAKLAIRNVSTKSRPHGKSITSFLSLSSESETIEVSAHLKACTFPSPSADSGTPAESSRRAGGEQERAIGGRGELRPTNAAALMSKTPCSRSRTAQTKSRADTLVAQNSYFLQGCVGVHDRPVVWSGVRMRGYPPRCVTSKSVRLDEFCDACQGRVGPVLDCFQSCQSVERVGR